ncbi:MAG: hypothetical protein KJ906_03625 [Nanoarchaeota archaeon]|nr:hypothetical protein [Nanoarchaeota archaeon]
MAATAPGPQKMKLDYIVDRKTYDGFVKLCSKKGFAPHIIIEKLMKRFVDTGQV